MKFLISSDFKVMRKGEMVAADEKAGEFIYETGNARDASMGQLQEIAKANKIQIGNKPKKDQLISKIDEALMNDQTVAEQNTPTETQKVEEIVKAGIAAGKNDDAMLIDIVQAGVSFKRASKLFKQVLEAQGVRIASKDRNTQAGEILAAMDFNPQNAADVEAAVKEIEAKVKDTNAKQALTAVKKYAKEHQIELPKTVKGQRGVSGFRSKVFDWILANPNGSVAELKEFIASMEKPESIQKRFVGIYDLVHKFHAKYSVQTEASETAAA